MTLFHGQQFLVRVAVLLFFIDGYVDFAETHFISGCNKNASIQVFEPFFVGSVLGSFNLALKSSFISILLVYLLQKINRVQFFNANIVIPLHPDIEKGNKKS